jgi:hypothetical protein
MKQSASEAKNASREAGCVPASPPGHYSPEPTRHGQLGTKRQKKKKKKKPPKLRAAVLVFQKSLRISLPEAPPDHLNLPTTSPHTPSRSAQVASAFLPPLPARRRADDGRRRHHALPLAVRTAPSPPPPPQPDRTTRRRHVQERALHRRHAMPPDADDTGGTAAEARAGPVPGLIGRADTHATRAHARASHARGQTARGAAGDAPGVVGVRGRVLGAGVPLLPVAGTQLPPHARHGAQPRRPATPAERWEPPARRQAALRGPLRCRLHRPRPPHTLHLPWRYTADPFFAPLPPLISRFIFLLCSCDSSNVGVGGKGIMM